MDLIEASKSGNRERLKELLTRGADPNLQNQYGWTALIFASEAEHDKVVQLFYQYKATLKIQRFYRRYRLYIMFNRLRENLIEYIYRPDGPGFKRAQASFYGLI